MQPPAALLKQNMELSGGQDLFLSWKFWYKINLKIMGNMMPVFVQQHNEIVDLKHLIVKVSSDTGVGVGLMHSLADKQDSFEGFLKWVVFKTLHYMHAYKHYEKFQEQGILMLNAQVKFMKNIFPMKYIEEKLVVWFEGVLPTMLEAMQNHEVDYVRKGAMKLTIDLVNMGMKLEASMCAKMTEVCLKSLKSYDKTEKMQQFACTCLAIFSPESLAMEIFVGGSCHYSIGEVALVLKKSFDMQTKSIAVSCLLVLMSLYNHRVPVDIFEVLFTEIYSQSDLIEKDNMPFKKRLVAFNIMNKATQCVKIMLCDSNASVHDYRAQLESMYYVPMSEKLKRLLTAIRAKNGY